jgi:TonB family protein
MWGLLLIAAQAPTMMVAPEPEPLNKNEWITAEDYPATALRYDESGTAAFQLTVDARGAVTDCSITGSSGSQVLDDTTCTLIRQRAKFAPAVNAAGKPVAGYYSSSVRWALEGQVLPMPITAWSSIARIKVSPRGRVLSCTASTHGTPPEDALYPCDDSSDLNRDHGIQAMRLASAIPTGKGAEMIIEVNFQTDASPGFPAEYDADGQKIIALASFRIAIEESGEVKDCAVASWVAPDDRDAPTCKGSPFYYTTFIPARDANGNPIAVTATQTIAMSVRPLP